MAARIQRPGEQQDNTLAFEPEFYHGSSAPLIRAAIGAVGLGLVGVASRKRGSARWVLAALGLGAITRSLTQLSLSQMIGILTTPSIRLRRTLIVHAPVEAVYSFWKDFSNYPRFMSYVKNVEVNDKGGLEWTVIGPKGLQLKWDTVVGAMQENQLISWQSASDSLIATHGKVAMTGNMVETRLNIELEYALPAGFLAQALIRLLGFDPRQKIDEDLAVMRKLIEEAPRSVANFP